MTMLRCPICRRPPQGPFYNPETDRWIIGCECAKDVQVCGKGHETFDEALSCWNNIVAETEKIERRKIS